MDTTGIVDTTDYAMWLRRAGVCENTMAQRIGFAASRFREWGTWSLSPTEIGDWLARHEGWTRCTYFSHLRSLYRWLAETGRVQEDPTEGLKRPRAPRPNPRPLSTAEAVHVLTAATGDLRAHLMLGFLAGLRAHEIAKVRGEDVTQDGLFVVGKGGQAAMVPTHPELWALAQLYPRHGWWFPSDRTGLGHICGETVTYRVSKHFRSLGIEGSSHRARHSFGTTLMRDGANLRVVQSLMRHASLATTAAYLGVEDAERSAAIARLSVA